MNTKKFLDLFYLEIGEKFKICNERGFPYWVRDKKHKSHDEFWFDETGHLKSSANTHNELAFKLICGQYSVVKIPFIPLYSEVYYYIDKYGDVCSGIYDSTFDVMCFNSGNCFRNDLISDNDYNRVKQMYQDSGFGTETWAK